MKDRFHIGEEAAEAQGTWSHGYGRRQTKEEEEMEAQDEADGLVDQRKPESVLAGAQQAQQQQQVPSLQSGPQPMGIPGLIPGIGAPPAPPAPPAVPGLPGPPAGMDPTRLAAL
ncbi:pre-mRNA cleavage and polyadenylation factor (CPF) complex subunit, partial [Ascosphaera atra]